MEEALSRVKQLATTVDGAERQQLMASLHNLAYSMESPDDTLHRYGAMNLQTAVVKIGFDLKLFKYLTGHGGPMTIAEISQKTGADQLLTHRILRYLAATGALEEVDSSQYAPNHVTKNLAEKVTEAGVNHYFATVSPEYQVLPRFLKKTNYQNPTDELNTGFQEAWNTPLHQFAWFTEHPENLSYFNDFMAFRREPQISWLAVYPVQERARDWSPGRPLYVNIGGGIGHQCAEFKKAHPNLPGRVILQDLPHSIAQAMATHGVENISHDFFKPQPVHGAKFYYMRGVLHNHPLHKVRKILENTKLAMTADSILLIDEMIIPETNAHVNAVSMDLTMMTAFAGGERSESYWRGILDEAGLKLVKTYLYNPVNHESVMEVYLA